MVDRRRLLQCALLVGAAGPVAAGCGDDRPSDDTADPSLPTPDQLAELELIAAYDAAIAEVGQSRRALYERIREEHAQHLLALGAGPKTQPAAPPTTAPGRTSLVRAERRAMRRRTDAAEAAGDAEQAQVLALIAASEAQHVAALEQL